MSRKSKHRIRARKARRRAQKAEDEVHRARGELPPRLRSTPRPDRTKPDGTRWTGLEARGGLAVSFRPTGLRVAIDFDAPDAEHVLSEAVARTLHPEVGET